MLALIGWPLRISASDNNNNNHNNSTNNNINNKNNKHLKYLIILESLYSQKFKIRASYFG